MAVLQRTEPFAALEEKVLEQLGGLLQPRHYTGGQCVAREGEPSPGALFIVAAGRAEIVAGTPDHGSPVGWVYPGQCFGETVVLTGGPCPASVWAAEELDCLLLERKHLEDLLLAHPALMRYFAPGEEKEGLAALADAGEEARAPAGDAGQPSRKTARELMSAPVVSCGRAAPIAEVAALMARGAVSSVAVLKPDGRLAGLVTEKDLVEKVLAAGPDGAPPGGWSAGTVMTAEPVQVGPDAFFYDILLAMVRRRVKHVLVMEDERPLGVVSVRDLVRWRNTGVLSVVDELEDQRTVAGLAAAASEVDRVLKAMVAEEAPLPELFSLMTEFHDRLVRKVLAICEEELAAEGYGAPPAPYCWLSMGSGGRKEQVLRTDQDNALIWQEAAPERAEEARRYFHRLGTKAVEALEACGFARCKGDAMASNPFWCRSLPEWRAHLMEWTRHPEPDHLRLLGIFLDFRAVYGEARLERALRTYVRDLFASFPVILHLLAEDDAAARVPTGPWSLVLTGGRGGEHRGRFNLKTAACVHLVDCLRLLALRHRLDETSSLDRLRELTRRGVFGKEESAVLSTAYQTLTLFRIRHQLRQVAAGEAPDEWLALSEFSRRERGQLLAALKAVARLQELVAYSFLAY